MFGQPEAVLVGDPASALYVKCCLSTGWHDWLEVKTVCVDCAMLIFERIAGLDNSYGRCSKC